MLLTASQERVSVMRTSEGALQSGVGPPHLLSDPLGTLPLPVLAWQRGYLDPIIQLLWPCHNAAGLCWGESEMEPTVVVIFRSRILLVFPLCWQRKEEEMKGAPGSEEKGRGLKAGVWILEVITYCKECPLSPETPPPPPSHRRDNWDLTCMPDMSKMFLVLLF